MHVYQYVIRNKFLHCYICISMKLTKYKVKEPASILTFAVEFMTYGEGSFEEIIRGKRKRSDSIF